MGTDTEGTSNAGEPASRDQAPAVDSLPVEEEAVCPFGDELCGCDVEACAAEANQTREDSRRARLAILNAPTDYSKNRNRLSNVRWPLGEEPYPDVEATSGSIGAKHVDTPPEDGWFNLKIEQHLPPEPPKQRHLLHGGPELRINCEKCDKPLHIAGEKPVKEVLLTAGYVFNPDRDWKKLDKEVLIVAACPNGHVVQFRGDIIQRLIKRS